MARRFLKAEEYTRKYKDTLLPCKYCGNTDIRIASDRIMFPKSKDGWFVTCTTPACDCTNTYTSVRTAIDKWNLKQGGVLS